MSTKVIMVIIRDVMQEVKKPWEKVKEGLMKRGLSRTHVDISDEARQQLHIAAIEDKTTFRVIINEAIHEYLKNRYARKMLAKK